MQEPQSKAYFEKRAAEERLAAQQAGDDRAAQLHTELAHRYDDIARGDAAEPTAQDEPPMQGILPGDFTILP